MRFVENDQIEKTWTELVEAKTHRLLSRDEEALRLVDAVV